MDGYYSSSSINSFTLYFEYRSQYSSSLHISYNAATRNGNTFMYASSFEAIYSNYNYYSGEFVMWIQVYRSSLTPSYTYSERLYVNFGKCMIVIV